MIQLNALLWMMALLFGYIGFSRGWNKEIIAMSGIILGLFALHQYDELLRETLLGTIPNEQKFFIQSIIFGLIVFFAYQTRALIGQDVARARGQDGRDELQSHILGAIAGFINGYLVWGSLWYFMDINNYPLSPFIVRPPAGTPSAATINQLPLYVLAGGPNGPGDLLAFAVIVLFLIVLVVI